MNKENCVIRLEKKEERREVENLVRRSVWNVYRPGCLEHYVLHTLRDDPSFVPELDFVLKELKEGYLDGVTGEYAAPDGYFVDEAAAEEFDRGFPQKEKLKLPGQIF